MMCYCVALVVVIVILFLCILPKKPPNFPPGPRAYPVIGSALLFLRNPRKCVTLTEIGNKYGPVSGIFLGSHPSIIANGWTTVRDVLTKDEFQNRPDLYIQRKYWQDRSLGIILSNGPLWKEQRIFCLSALRDCGFVTEVFIQDELMDLIQHIKIEIFKNEDSVISMQKDTFKFSVLNILWSTFCGRRHSRDNDGLNALVDAMTEFSDTGLGFGSLINDWPFLRHVPFFSEQYDKTQNNHMTVNQIIKEEIKEHKLIRNSGKSSLLRRMNNFIDIYLNKMEMVQNSSSGVATYFSEDELIGVCSDSFLAATDTTCSALAYGMLYMILYPEIQEKVQTQLDNVLKRRTPTLVDRPNLPYVEAVITELFRIASPVPITVPHCTTKDTMLNGFSIPKDTAVNVNLHSVHMDKNYWEDPENFRPDRFLDPTGKFVKPSRVIPFGLGSRSCFGASLASAMHFLLFAGMLQAFKLEMNLEKPRPTSSPLPYLTEAPMTFTAKVTSRK